MEIIKKYNFDKNFNNQAIESPLWNFALVKVGIKGFQMTSVTSKSEDTHIEQNGSEKGLPPMRGGKNYPLHQTSVACTQDMSVPMVTLVCALTLKNMTISKFKLGLGEKATPNMATWGLVMKKAVFNCP